jgi:hypothetical protein
MDGPWGRALLALWLAVVPLHAGATAFDEMVDFDKSYIAALALTSQAAADPAKGDAALRAMQALQAKWPAFRGGPAVRGNPAVDAALPKIGDDIGTASRAAADARWSEAHEALEPVRMRMMSAREQSGIAYYPDLLTAFHEPMEAIVLAVKGKSPGSFGPNDRAEIERHLAEALARWHRVERAPLEAGPYRLTSAQLERARKLVGDERQALQRLSDAARGDDSAALIRAATGIKPAFAQLYMLFGSPGT